MKMNMVNGIAGIAVLTSKESWYVPRAEILVSYLCSQGYDGKLCFEPEDVGNVDAVFILSYFHLVSKEFLSKHKHNLVIHCSDLPQGKGWSPITWQILEGKSKIPIVIFEVVEDMDAGDVYFKDYVEFEGHELLDEIRLKLAQKIIELCIQFLRSIPKGHKQTGDETYYRRRNPADSMLDPQKTIAEQFELLRVVDNKRYPAFFNHRGYKYELFIRKVLEQ